MALSAATVFEVRTTGSDNNGGGFVTGASGTDWSQQDAAQYTGTTGQNVSPSTTFNDTNANFGTDVVGNLLYIASGDGTVGRYQITARNSATSLTLDRTQGGAGGTTIVYNIGGAVASPGAITGALVANNTVYIKSGTYTLTSSSSNVSNGRMTISVAQVRMIGYGSTRNDLGTKPIIHAGAITGITILSVNAFCCLIENIEINANSGTSNVGVATSAGWGSTFHLVHVKNCPGNHFSLGNRNTAIGCIVEGGSGIGFITTNDGTMYACRAKSIGNTAFYQRHGNSAYFCIADSCTNGFLTEGDAVALCCHCIAYNNTNYGFQNGEATDPMAGVNWINCIAEDNGTYGFRQAATGNLKAINCATYSNTSGASQNVNMVNAITLTSSAFVDAANGDFRLNSTAGGGGAVKATSTTRVAYPDAFPGISSTTNYADIGAVQAAPSGGTGSIFSTPVIAVA